MKKELTFDEIEFNYTRLAQEWDKSLKDLHLSNKSLYNLIALKKKLEEKHNTIQEAVSAIMQSYGATINERGALQLPQEKIEAANKELSDFAKQKDEIEYNEILIKEQDSIPSTLMEILYDFIIME